MNFLAHHGYHIPLGYANAFALQSSMEEVHGGSPYGAGTFANVDGSRQPSTLELEIAEKQGEAFVKSATKLVKVAKTNTTTTSKSAATSDAGTTSGTAAGTSAATGTSAPKESTKEASSSAKRKLPMAPLLELNNLQKPLKLLKKLMFQMYNNVKWSSIRNRQTTNVFLKKKYLNGFL